MMKNTEVNNVEKREISAAKIMVLVPHQDDEILMAAGLIRHAVLEKVPVFVVMATNGDYGSGDDSIGKTRLRESMEGLKLLGLSMEQFYILGYADTGMPEADSFLSNLYKESDGQKIYRSFCGNQTYGLEEKTEYHAQKYGKHAPYCRDSFRQDLKEIVKELAPTHIFTTSEYDMHGDHSGLYHFLREVLAELKEEGYLPALYAGLVHSGAGDENWPRRDTGNYDCPEKLEEMTELRWETRICLPVPEEMRLEHGEKNLKYRALKCYETALEPNAYEFLMSFIKDEEIFWKMEG